ncbi:MAG: hypothetical protein EU548_00370 [Promethearchaeota archaeon]|nr:MAG: hypothetical protein EU548_00370 [Candidatus Lokiarchaeota archaeon]
MVGNILGSVGKMMVNFSESEDFIGNMERFGEYIEANAGELKELEKLKKLEKIGELEEIKEIERIGEEIERAGRLGNLKALWKLRKLAKLGIKVGEKASKIMDEVFEEEEAEGEVEQGEKADFKEPQASGSEQKGYNPKRENQKEILKQLITQQNMISIENLSKILEIPYESAENLVYELVGEGVNGSLVEDKFIILDGPEEVIEILFTLIDNMNGVK